jgi:Bacterial mobilisation protein (MobC)
MPIGLRDQWKLSARSFVQKMQKSCAQVETLVRPQVVSPKSSELKLGRQRPYRLMARFSKSEKDGVEAKAEAAGLSINEYIRATSMGSDYKPPTDPELIKALLKLNKELTAQGNNLNQIAHHMNSGEVLPSQGESLLGIISRSMLQTHKAIRAALSQGKTPDL